MIRRAAAVGAALLLGCADAVPDAPAVRAAAWLVARQGGDGLWRSDTHAVLGTGQALTPFALYALSHLSPEERAPFRAAIDRGLDRLPVDGAEYPSYALALSIVALRRLRPEADRSGLEARLRALRLDEANGWGPDDPEYGGWDHGAVPPRKPACRRPDLSVTAFAVEALGADEKVRRFVARCRAPEGGYVFTPSPTWAHENKAGPGRGYETPTLDAARILGVPPEEAAAVPERWREALRFYRSFARAKAGGGPARDLEPMQRPDGSFANPDGGMKEDDPIVATGLALAALRPGR